MRGYLLSFDGDIVEDGQSGGAKEVLHHDLIHAGAGCGDARADVGHISEFKHPLDRPVFTVRTVQYGKDDVKALAHPRRRHGSGAGLDSDQAGIRRIGPEGRGNQPGGQAFAHPFFKSSKGVLADQPPPVLGDADGDHLILGRVERPHDRLRGHEAHFVLPRAPSEEDGDAQSLCQQRSLQLPTAKDSSFDPRRQAKRGNPLGSLTQWLCECTPTLYNVLWFLERREPPLRELRQRFREGMRNRTAG